MNLGVRLALSARPSLRGVSQAAEKPFVYQVMTNTGRDETSDKQLSIKADYIREVLFRLSGG
jgi:hypothetical protein